jgi:hypothetical protein
MLAHVNVDLAKLPKFVVEIDFDFPSAFLHRWKVHLGYWKAHLLYH